MANLEWDPSYLVDYADIDLQHQYFFNLIARIDKAREADDLQASAPYLMDLFAELYLYARFHFRSEENMMRKADYPGIDVHQEHHNQLMKELHEKERALSVNFSHERLEATLQFLVDWFVHHTTREDRELATFLRKAQRD